MLMGYAIPEGTLQRVPFMESQGNFPLPDSMIFRFTNLPKKQFRPVHHSSRLLDLQNLLGNYPCHPQLLLSGKINNDEIKEIFKYCQ